MKQRLLSGLRIIENTFKTTISPKYDYRDQVFDLDQSGDLANRKKIVTVLFDLCQVVDGLINDVVVLEQKLQVNDKEETFRG